MKTIQRTETKPVLVTGVARSGTTWIGRMLAASPSLYYIHEPFNVDWHPGIGILDVKIKNWLQYITLENEHLYYDAFDRMLKGKYSLYKALKKVRCYRDFRKILSSACEFRTHKKANRKPLIKDPSALFSASWLHEKFNCHVIIVIRHPAAFVNSVKRLNWSFDFNELLKQPLLMNQLLPGYETLFNEYNRKDSIDQASLWWKISYEVIAGYKEKYNNWIFLRYEDIATQPMKHFINLYCKLGIQWNDKVQKTIIYHSLRKNVEVRNWKSIKRDSKSQVGKWKSSLTEEEMQRIKACVSDISKVFYSEEEWNV